MYKILLTSTILISLTLFEVPAQAKSFFLSKEGAVDIFDNVVRLARTIAHRVTHRQQIYNHVADNSVNDKETDVPLRKWVFHRYLYESTDGSFCEHSFKTSPETGLNYLSSRQRQYRGDLDLKDLENQSDCSVLKASLSTIMEEEGSVEEAQYLSYNRIKLALKDEWLGDSDCIIHNEPTTTNISLRSRLRTTQPYTRIDSREAYSKPFYPMKSFLKSISVEDAQKLSDSQLRRVLLKAWGGQLDEDD